jgi:hypothetical protein
MMKNKELVDRSLEKIENIILMVKNTVSKYNLPDSDYLDNQIKLADDQIKYSREILSLE